jgi:putative hydrolase of the HAD superfamily
MTTAAAIVQMPIGRQGGCCAGEKHSLSASANAAGWASRAGGAFPCAEPRLTSWHPAERLARPATKGRWVIRGLLLDIGGVLIRTPFELLGPTERRLGLAPGALGSRGLFATEPDEVFAQVANGELTERAYWKQRAEAAASLLGTTPDTRSFMQALFDLPPAEVVRQDAAALLADARAAGLRTGLLTNDLYDFHGDEWVASIPVFHTVDALVDVSQHGVLKPDARAYQLGIEAMGLEAGELLFLDDQPVNVAAARGSGLAVIEIDVTAPGDGFAKARAALGLPRP